MLRGPTTAKISIETNQKSKSQNFQQNQPRISGQITSIHWAKLKWDENVGDMKGYDIDNLRSANIIWCRTAKEFHGENASDDSASPVGFVRRFFGNTVSR